ncbi:C6 transcription factor [Botryosphaeria dothidea]|uniref:C6 transcription factor n=1 Tax=Botryosphaeria dothidea TaxID=55169 RepID=A0A8H4J3X7_9PEZI|nr:C6 transcription factor [Botryosphaeria dothidea]
MSPDDPDFKLHMTDLELLHHFTINTAATLSTAPELRTWWRIDVPHLAFSHPFVMRALLALSGMHIAHTLLAPPSSPLPPPSAFAIPQPSSPSELHHLAQLQISRAHTQHALALRTANHLLPTNTSTPPAPSAATSAPLYICAVITMLTAFAAPRDPDALLFVDSTSSTIAPWLQLSRAVKRIVDQGSEQAVLMAEIGVPLRMALSSNIRGTHACFSPPAKAAGESGEAVAVAELAALRAWLEADGRGRCADAAESLMATFETFEVAGDAVAMRAVVGWVCTVDEAFLVAVAEREQGALAVFAFFAVLLHWVENGNWWVNGWGRHLVTTIDGLMGVEGERWLRWPREQIGIYRVEYQPVDCVVI